MGNIGNDHIVRKLCLDESILRSVCLLPFWFFSCHENEQNLAIENELLILGKANLQAWVSSALYEHIYSGKIEKRYIKNYLSVAHTLYKKSINHFYSLIDYNQDKMQIIDNMLCRKDGQYLKKQPVDDIHLHFRHMCENSYKKSMSSSIVCIVVVWLLGYGTRSNSHMKAYEFFKNYLNARQLASNDNKLVDDMLNNVCTPATFLMRAKYGSTYIHTMMRARIDTSTKRALSSLKNISFFDHKKFTKLYVAKH